MKLTTRRICSMAAVVALGGGVTGLAAANGATARPSERAPLAGATGTAQADGLAQSFTVLTQAATTPLPGQLAQDYEGPPGLGIEADQARYVASADSWVVPGTDGVCLLSMNIVGQGVGSAVCQTIPRAVAGDLVDTATTPSGTSVVTGLVPNGVTSVNVMDETGSTTTVPVVTNVFQIIGGHPTSIATVTSAGVGPSRRLNGTGDPQP